MKPGESLGDAIASIAEIFRAFLAIGIFAAGWQAFFDGEREGGHSTRESRKTADEYLDLLRKRQQNNKTPQKRYTCPEVHICLYCQGVIEQNERFVITNRHWPRQMH